MSLANSDFDDEGFDDALEEMPLDEQGVAGMDANAPPASAEPNYRKQGFSIYSVMLILSFVCLTVAMILLFQEAGNLK